MNTKSKHCYYISQLVRAQWLVNLAGRTLLYGPLKFKVGFVAKLFRDLSKRVLNFYSLKLSYTLNYVIKPANDLKTVSNWLVLLSKCQKFEAFPSPRE